MKKILSVCAFMLACVAANASTPYKNLYVVAEAYPSGSGLVYLGAKNSTDDAYVKEQSEDLGETAFIKYVGAENGDGIKDGTTGELEDKTGSCKATDHIFELNLHYEAAAGYELLCLAEKIAEDGVYTADMCYSVIHGESLIDNRTFDFDYSVTPLRINVNNANHPEDGNDNDGNNPENRQKLLDEGTWNDTPDTYVYAIFRKIGETTPSFNPEPSAVQGVNADVKTTNAYFNLGGQRVNAGTKGIVIKDGKAFIVK